MKPAAPVTRSLTTSKRVPAARASERSVEGRLPRERRGPEIRPGGGGPSGPQRGGGGAGLSGLQGVERDGGCCHHRRARHEQEQVWSLGERQDVEQHRRDPEG